MTSPQLTTGRRAPHRVAAVVLALALAAAFLPVLARAATAAEDFSFTIEVGTEGNTAVRFNQPIDVSGQIPAGRIHSARLVGVEADGDRPFQRVPIDFLNRTSTSNDYLNNDNGQLSGRLTLACLFNAPNATCSVPHEDVYQVILEITLQNQSGGEGDSGASNPLRVDYIRPMIREYELIDTDTVLVRFTEPVRMQFENALDWRITNPEATVLTVGGPQEGDCAGHYEPGEDAAAGDTGCTRTLTFFPAMGEDAQPTAEFFFADDRVPNRKPYDDFATNQMLFGSTAIGTAADKIRPAVPNIDSIDGETPSDDGVHSRTAAPQVRLSNLLAGHTAQIAVTGPGGFSRVAEKLVPEGSNAVDVDVPTLPADGAYAVTALAIDPHGNRSDETSKNAARDDGARSTVQYVLDTVAPQLLTATLETRRTVRVKFTEAVLPAGNAGRWFVGDAPVTAEGSGDERTLTSSTDLNNTNDLDVRWEPTSDEPGSPGRYGDRAGNGLATITGIPLDDLPPIGLPSITQPTTEQYIDASSVTVAGTAPNQPNLVAELFERGVDEPRDSTPVDSGEWSFDVPLDADRRYEFEVRLRDTLSGVSTQRVAVPDVVRDTTAPVVDVTSPAQAPITVDNPTERREQYGVGDSVTVEWTATDDAPGDSERSEHGDTVDIILVAAGGARRTVAEGIEHQTGEQKFTYTLTAADLGGAASRELSFEVAVNDLADNRGTDTSAPILLLATLIGYTPVLTQPGVIEARFPVLLVGTTLPTEWYVDGSPAQQASNTTRDGVTVIRLTVMQTSDPNDTPEVVYRKAAVNVSPLRTADGVEVSPGPRNAQDAIAPAFSLTAPAGGVVDADAVTFSGTTDETEFPNTVSAFRADANGAPQGSAIARTTAGQDGTWTLAVPLEQNAINRIVLRAVDPSGNISQRLPDPAYTVTEDSLDPVVRMVSPVSESLVNPMVNIRWETTEANPDFVDIDYRVSGEQWREVEYGTADDGSYDWELPEHVRTAIFAIRVTATDKAGKTGSATASGLRLDFELPALTKARATGAQVVELTFSEPVTLDGSGFEIGGARVRSVKGAGTTRTVILRRSMDSATPRVAYDGESVRDAAGNAMAPAELTAKRSFAFAVKNLQGQRLATKRVRIAWSDVRNEPEHLRGYRIYRDGHRIAQLDVDARTFVDRDAKGRHRYTVRAVDDRRRLSSVRRTTIGR